MYAVIADDHNAPAHDDKYVYVFHHFIKCGGTTVTGVLRSWFNVVNDHFRTFEELPEYIANRKDLNSLKPGDCMVGHYAVEGTYLFQRYPELLERKDKFRVFTFLREPLDFCLSFYFYSKKEGRMKQSLKEFLESNRNLLAYYMPCHDDFVEVMDRYFFTGVTERMEESLRKLSNLLGKPLPVINVLNVSERDEQNELINDGYKQWFREYNDIDYKMYEYACKKLDAVLP